MAVPKIERDCKIFEPNVCDKINKKINIIEDNMQKLSAPNLAPKLDIADLNLTFTSSSITGNTSNNVYYTANIELKNNGSLVLISKDATLKQLNLNITLSNIKKHSYDGSSWSVSDSTTFTSSNLKVGKLNFPSHTDVYLLDSNQDLILNIPKGSDDVYLIFLKTPADVYLGGFYI